MSSAARRAWVHAQMSDAQRRQYLEQNPHDAERMRRALSKRARKWKARCGDDDVE